MGAGERQPHVGLGIADQEGNLHKHASAELRKTSSMSGDSLGTGMFGSLDDGTEEGSAEN